MAKVWKQRTTETKLDWAKAALAHYAAGGRVRPRPECYIYWLGQSGLAESGCGRLMFAPTDWSALELEIDAPQRDVATDPKVGDRLVHGHDTLTVEAATDNIVAVLRADRGGLTFPSVYFRRDWPREVDAADTIIRVEDSQ